MLQPEQFTGKLLLMNSWSSPELCSFSLVSSEAVKAVWPLTLLNEVSLFLSPLNLIVWQMFSSDRFLEGRRRMKWGGFLWFWYRGLGSGEETLSLGKAVKGCWSGAGAGEQVPPQLFFNRLTVAGQIQGKVRGCPFPHPSSPVIRGSELGLIKILNVWQKLSGQE